MCIWMVFSLNSVSKSSLVSWKWNTFFLNETDYSNSWEVMIDTNLWLTEFKVQFRKNLSLSKVVKNYSWKCHYYKPKNVSDFQGITLHRNLFRLQPLHLYCHDTNQPAQNNNGIKKTFGPTRYNSNLFIGFMWALCFIWIVFVLLAIGQWTF